MREVESRCAQKLFAALQLAHFVEQSDDADSPAIEEGSKAKVPWAEAVRLGRPLYVTPGKYTLTVTVGEASAKTELEIGKPRSRSSRAPEPPYKVRGKKDDD